MIAAQPNEVSGALPRSALSARQQQEMFELLERYFDGVDREQFERDLKEKNWVLQLRREGRLVGFSTLLATDSLFEGVPITVIYSGDTIVAPEAWGSPELARIWIERVNRIRSEFPGRRCFWLLLTSGFRTYKFLPVFWREFYPRNGVATPPSAGQLMRNLAKERYGDNYDEVAGIVRFPRPQRLRAPLASVPAGQRRDPDVEFFLIQNPGHLQGDELVCLTEISETNLTRAGWRMVSSDS